MKRDYGYEWVLDETIDAELAGEIFQMEFTKREKYCSVPRALPYERK